MTKLGAKLLTLTIKTPHKRTFVYKFISNNQFAGDTLKREKAIEKLLHYAHNYLTKPNLAVIHLSGGLGNQMYNYTFGKALESKGYDVIFDASDYKNLQGDSQNGGGGNRAQNDANQNSANLNTKNPPKPTNIRNLEITNFNITLPLDLDFDKELFFDLADKDRANHPRHKRIKQPYKYLTKGNAFQTIPLDSIPIHKNTYFDGYLFSLAYFKHLDLTLRKEFTLKTSLSPANLALKEHILNTSDSVFLHIRRGDYVSTKECVEYYVNLCESKYYDGAIKFVKSKLAKPHIFIFSNDIAWCERNFLVILSDEAKKGVEFEFVANNGEDNAAHEMELMRVCQNAIIANSTFSWWAGYLIDNPHKIVVMPNSYGEDFAQLTYNDKSQVYESVVLVDLHSGEIIKRQ